MDVSSPASESASESPVSDSVSESALVLSAQRARARHELRTPLNQIQGYTELLLEEVNEQESARHFAPDLQRVLAASRRLLQLIDEQFASPETATAQTTTSSSATATPAVSTAAATFAIGESAIIRHAPSTHHNPAHVLVVDDNALNRDVLRRRLEHDGHQVTEADSGETALQLMRAEPFELVLLDVLMPGMDGVAVLQRVHDEPELRRIPIIVLSALDEADSAVRCIELGADDYLPKPFNPVLLRARINASLEKKRLRDIEARLFEQLREGYERVTAMERWREEWTQMLVHDLRTPLTSILGGLQTLEFAGELGPISREIVDLSTRSSYTMMGLINDLLDVARLEDGTLQLDLALCAPRELLSDAVAQTTSIAVERGVTLQLEVPADLPMVRADREKISRVLVNLLGNALKFTPSGGHVVAGAQDESEQNPAQVRFFVRDTGEGIPAEAVSKIFERFGQVESKRQRKRGGTGLGLTFCKLVVEAHDGHIGVQSNEGEGSNFYFSLLTCG